ncbi:MAG: hypothetical protein J6C99_10895 [Lachnospiraceae bacterium]|nr:hypothetical protein [Lachnospiraceae bacterium]
MKIQKKKRMFAFLMAFVCMLGMLVMPDAGHVQAAGGVETSGRAHVQTFGDQNGKIQNQNGMQTLVLGTRGLAKRVESITVNFVNNTGYTGTLQYRVHRQTYGWENVWAQDGAISGTTGQGKRLEGISITVNDNEYSGGITYQTHVQSYGWMDWVSNGEMSGTQGQAKRLEAIRIQLVKKDGKYHLEYLLRSEYEETPEGPIYCNGCRSRFLSSYENECNFCGMENGGYHFWVGYDDTCVKTVKAVQVEDEPEYNGEITYCTKCETVKFNYEYTADEFYKMLDKWKEWKKDTNPTHAHIWEPIFGKHHESMVRSGSYRSSIGEDIKSRQRGRMV